MGESEASTSLSCHFSQLGAAAALFLCLNFLRSAPSWGRTRGEAERLFGSAGASVAPCCQQQQLQMLCQPSWVFEVSVGCENV